MNLTVTMFVQAAVFALFVWATIRWPWRWLLEKVEVRQKAIAEGLAEAERGKSSLADAKKETDKMLAEARSRAQDIVAQAEKQAALRIEESKGTAKTEGERLVAAANAQIQQEVQAAKSQLREQVAALAVAGAEKILKREVDAKTHADMLGQLKGQL